MKIKVDDKILVIAGKDKGKTSKVQKVYKKSKKIVAEKINIKTKHIKKTPQRKGERIKFEAPFDISNVKIICPSCNKAGRVGYAIPDEGRKYRICKKCNASLDLAKTIQKK